MAKVVDKLQLEVQAEIKPHDRETVILFELLDEISRLKDWRFENCKHKSGWCRDKRSCDSCQYAKTGDFNDKT